MAAKFTFLMHHRIHILTTMLVLFVGYIEQSVVLNFLNWHNTKTLFN